MEKHPASGFFIPRSSTSDCKIRGALEQKRTSFNFPADVSCLCDVSGLSDDEEERVSLLTVVLVCSGRGSPRLLLVLLPDLPLLRCAAAAERHVGEL